MAEEGRPAVPGGESSSQAAGQTAPQQMQIPIDMSALNSGYVNWFRFTGSAEELIVDLGLAPQLGQVPPSEPIKLTHRLVMNFFTAKRLLQSLQRAIGTFEWHYGPVEIDPQRRQRTPPGPRPPGS
jgi:hypothetical protein